jgi:hypothetical protein
MLWHLRSIIDPPFNSKRNCNQIGKEGRFSQKDAIHLACAIISDANFFLTCDDDLLKNAQKIKSRTISLNPVDYFRIEKTNMNDTEFLISAMQTLYKSLGVSAAVRFLALLQQGSTDYVDISNKIYENQTIEEIFSRAKKNWDKANA